MIFEKFFILGFNYSISWYRSIDTYYSLIFYSPKKAKALSTGASHSSFTSEKPWLGGCDVTGRILKSQTSEHNVDFSYQNQVLNRCIVCQNILSCSRDIAG